MRVLLLLALTTTAATQQVLLQIPGNGDKGFGLTAAFVDDLNCDGVPELLLGGGLSAAYLYDGATGLELRRFEGPQPGTDDDNFAVRVARLGDVTGDGLDEIAIGSRYADNGIPLTQVYSAVDGVLVWSLDIAGWGLARIEDLDGDGYPELGICDEENSYVVSGASGSIIFQAPRNPNLVRLNEIADAGDVNGDGKTDIITGNIGWANGPGEVLVRSGADYSVLPNHTHTGHFNADKFGMGIAGRGDVDGDGVPDLLACAAAWDPQADYVQVISGASGVVIREFQQCAGYTLAGRPTVAYLGDLDHDGRDDYVVAGGTETDLGCLTVYSGATGAVLSQHQGQFVGDGFGHTLSATHDFDGDGHRDVLVGVKPNFDPSQRYVQVVSMSVDAGHTYCTANPNSTGAAARIAFSGSTTVVDNDLTLNGSLLPFGQFGYFLMSQSTANVPNFGGSSGVLCLGAPIVRFNRPQEIRNSGGCGTMALSLDLGDLPQNITFLPGDTWYFQLWFRDTADNNSSNTSNGIEVLFR
jgi:FG-GAP-like repeat/FG-GAP repeat